MLKYLFRFLSGRCLCKNNPSIETFSALVVVILIKTSSQIIVSIDAFKLDETLFSKEVLEDPYILCVIEAQENNYLLGTREGHIISYNSVSNSFSKIYEDKHGAGIASIVIANKNEWWINTFKGVVSYDAAKKTTKRFSKGMHCRNGNEKYCLI